MIKRMRTAAVLAGALVIVAWPVLPAAHADSLSVNVDQPGDGQTFGSSSPIPVSGTVDTSLGTAVDRVSVEVFGKSWTHAVTACAPCNGGNSVSFSARATAPDRNGVYRVRVTASGHVLLGGIRVPDAVGERSFALAVPPNSPTGVTAQIVEGNKVRLSWTGVNHPDLVGYAIFRKLPGGAFDPYAGGITGNSWTDEKAGAVGGTIEYRVASVRDGAQAGSANWLTALSTAVAVNLPPVNQPTTPTTANNPNGGGDGGGGGGGNGTARTSGGGPSLDLGSFFNQSGSSDFGLPAGASELPAAPAEIDAGFSANLPLSGDTTGKIAGRQPGRPSTASGTGTLDTEPGGLGDTNRRALLVPVAAGSVLCVAALHLRWLSRRLEMPVLPGDLAAFDTVADLEHAQPDLDGFFPREAVGAGL